MATRASAARRGRPPRGAARLNRAAIVDATLDVIGADGAEAVGVRSVARELGVDPKSLYNHVDGRDGLLDAVTERLFGSISLPPRVGELRTDLRAIADAFRHGTLRHPRAAALVLTRQYASVEGLAPIQSLLEVFRTAGCPPHEAVHLLRTLLAALIGTLLRELDAGPTIGATDAEGIAARRAALEGSEFPAVAEAAPYLACFDSQAEFDFAMDLALDAVVARVRNAGHP